VHGVHGGRGPTAKFAWDVQAARRWVPPPMHKKAILDAGHGKSLASRPWFTGRVAAQIHEVLPAKKIIDDTVNEVATIWKCNAYMVDPKVKL